jgi:ferredoxin
VSDVLHVVVDHEACELNAICMGIAPEVFEVGEDDRLLVLVRALTPDQEADVRDAAASCPHRAITVRCEPSDRDADGA